MLSAVVFYSVLFSGLFLLPAALIFLLLSFIDHEHRLWDRFEMFADPLANRFIRARWVMLLRGRCPHLVAFVVRRFDPRDPWGLRATISLGFLLLGAHFLREVVRELVGKDPLMTLDLRLHNSVPLVRSAHVTSFMLALTEFGGPLFLWPFSVGLALLAYAREKRRLAATLLLAIATSSLLSAVIKLMVGHPRPTDSLIREAAMSFPSGHVLGSAIVYGVLASAIMASPLRRSLRAVCVAFLMLLIVGIGLSRLYLGVHWPSDLLGSLAIALSCLACLLFFLHYPAPLGRLETLSLRAPAGLVRSFGAVALACAGVTAVYLFGHAKLLPIGPPQAAQPIAMEDLLVKLPEHMSIRSEDLVGGEMEPVSLVFAGSRDDLQSAFERAGWTLADLPTPVRVVREAIAIATNGLDLSGPATPAYFADRPQTLTFEKPDAVTPGIRHRHHTRIWQTAYCVQAACLPLWVATASFDAGIEVSHRLHLPTHRIDPEIDLERDLIASDLATVGASMVGTLKVLEPSMGTNAAGDTFRTDGRAVVLRLSPRGNL